MLGWMIDGATWCIEMVCDKQIVIGAELHKIVGIKKGVSFKRIEILIGKIRHAATAVSTGKHLMTLLKKILQVKPQIVKWKDFPA